MTWGLDTARATYNVAHWSDGYFDINSQGELVAYPDGDQSKAAISLTELTEQFKKQGLTLPVLVRFTDILQNRVDTLTSAFCKAREARDYHGQYTCVYPIKVNQQRSVVSKLLAHPSGLVGLEAGSKPELMAILGVATSPITIVCNGYKDSEFLRLACIGQAMGHKVKVVVEKLSELTTLLAEIDDLGIEPAIGIRIRLNSVGKGKWQNTGGEKGKFGLTAGQVLSAVEVLKQHNKLHLMQMVHFHIGSQIANIRDIHRALRECSRHFAELTQLGVPLNTVDVGGGLGVDYEGSGSRSACSMNYTVDEYARNVVNAFAEVCEQHDLPHPAIITESGRALTAHHAVLITDVIDVEQAPNHLNPSSPEPNSVLVLDEMWQCLQRLNPRMALEIYHDAMHLFSEAHDQYVHGLVSMLEWAKIEQLYFTILHRVRASLSSARAHREVLDDLNEKLADKLFVNFSLFQSLPDVWGIQQLFPVMPIENLDKPLTQRAIIQDITCDSDGQIREYVEGAGIETSLPIPQYVPGQQYHVAMFMVGAYQEILGDLHNLFGDTDSVHVELNEQGYQLTNAIKGDSVKDVLKFVDYDSEILAENFASTVAKLSISDSEKAQYLVELNAGLAGYTYFED
ncbi:MULTISPECIES: biosynthetic arginine decarboxylase [unclassified Pseudoalteromonas]|uniref:biosynthetic arginine decarboxylase n=1 Tax=unclassified Pseudoalteromonas TaxID=194690 RepID=UPI0025B3CC90|nr:MULTISPECIES: biosynthetic arginine decarboxylase [unclassified Pseudoalteromonas]MDN3378594.1 biosynthetic arginine decarboxylase [Pseudoalteromonas sp. APC 3893]MDN3386994.1 biosynthetic arginine decarboxylase [Pseudoalteromonas sp. APC 4017]